MTKEADLVLEVQLPNQPCDRYPLWTVACDQANEGEATVLQHAARSNQEVVVLNRMQPSDCEHGQRTSRRNFDGIVAWLDPHASNHDFGWLNLGIAFENVASVEFGDGYAKTALLQL